MSNDNKNWFRIMKPIINQGYLGRMKGKACEVYIALLSHSDFEFKDVWPSLNTLTREVNVKERKTITLALNNLEDIGLIKKAKRKARDGKNLSNIYSFHIFEGLGVGDENTQGIGGQNTQGVEDENTQRWGMKIPTNNNKGTRIKTTTIVEELPDHDLSEIVVAILKNLKVDPSVWPSLNGMATSRVEALAALASQKANKNPGGWFRKAVEGGWSIPGYDKKAFEMQCDMIRKTATHLVSKATGSQYEIDRFQVGDKIVIHTDERGDVVLTSEEELADFTWAG